MKQNTSGIIAINIAALLLGGTILFAKLISMPAVSIIFGRAIIALIALFVFSLIAKQPLKISSKNDFIVIAALGILMALHWTSLFHSIQISTVAIASISLYTYPIITVFLEPLFLKEKIKFQDIIMAALVFAGILLIIPEFTIKNDITMGVIVGLFSALTFALRNIIQRKYVIHYPGTTLILYQIIIVIIALIPFIDFKSNLPANTNMIYIIVLGIFFTATPHSLFAFSLNNLKAKSVSIIASMQPFYATIFGVIILNEIPTIKVIFGGLLIVACAMYESFKVSSN